MQTIGQKLSLFFKNMLNLGQGDTFERENEVKFVGNLILDAWSFYICVYSLHV